MLSFETKHHDSALSPMPCVTQEQNHKFLAHRKLAIGMDELVNITQRRSEELVNVSYSQEGLNSYLYLFTPKS